MKIVLHTQCRENYGAHDWDGEGACPQYWKYKGGNTYVLHNVSVADAMGREIFDAVEAAVTERNEYFQEYVIGSTLIDDLDYVESEHVAEWDAPINLTLVDGKFLAHRYEKPDLMWREGFEGKTERWVQVAGNREEYELWYHLDDGRTLLYRDWLAEQEVREAA